MLKVLIKCKRASRLPVKGYKLYCHTDGFIVSNGNKKFCTKGGIYEVVASRESWFTVVDDLGQAHHFDEKYIKWFYVIN